MTGEDRGASVQAFLRYGAVVLLSLAGCQPAFKNHYGLLREMSPAEQPDWAPDAPAVVLSLRRAVEYRIGRFSELEMRVSVHTAYLIRRPEALAMATHLIPLGVKELADIQAVTHRPDGSIVPLPPSTLWSTTAVRDLQGMQRDVTLVPFPHVVPGSVVEVSYAYEVDHWVDSYPFELPNLPIQRAEFTITTPPEATFTLEAWGAPWKVKSTSTGMMAVLDLYASRDAPAPGVVATWRWMSFAPPRRYAILDDWTRPYGVFWRDFAKTLEGARLPAGFQPAAAGEPRRARAQRALGWVQDNLRHRALRPGEGLRSVRAVVRQRAGTEWERAAVLFAFLAELGVRARLVVPGQLEEGPAQPRYPEPWEDHLLLAMEEESGHWLYVDPACDACLVGEARASLAALPARWVTPPDPVDAVVEGGPGGTYPKAVPAVEVAETVLPAMHELPRRERYQLALGPDGVRVRDGEVILTGRAARAVGRRRSRAVPVLAWRDPDARRLLAGWSGGEVAWSVGENIATLKVQDALLVRRGLVLSSGVFATTVASLFGPGPLGRPPKTNIPHYIGPDASYQRTLTLQIPPGATMAEAPRDIEVQGPLGRYRRTVRVGTANVVVDEQLTVPARWYDSKEVGQLARFIEEVEAARAEALVLRLGEVRASPGAPLGSGG